MTNTLKSVLAWLLLFSLIALVDQPHAQAIGGGGGVSGGVPSTIRGDKTFTGRIEYELGSPRLYFVETDQDPTNQCWLVANSNSGTLQIGFPMNSVCTGSDSAIDIERSGTALGDIELKTNTNVTGTLDATVAVQVGGTDVCQEDGTDCPSFTGATTLCLSGGSGCDGDLAIGDSVIIRKSALESVTSSTTLQNDDELFWTPTSSGEYQFFMCMKYNTGGGFGLKFAVNRGTAGSNNATFYGIAYNNGTGTTIQKNGIAGPGDSTYQVSLSGNTVGTYEQVCVNGSMSLSGGIAYNLQWAQVSSGATAARIHADSWIKFTRVI